MRNQRKVIVLMFSFLIFVSITVVNVKADNVSNYQNIYDKSINLINKFNDNSKANVDAQNATNDEAKQEFSKYRQRYHYSSISGYAGDVQTIRKDKSGVWNFYYISDSGWRHVTSSDLIHFKDCGIAIKPIIGIPQGTDGFKEDNRDPYLWYNSKINKIELDIAQTRDNKTKHGIAQYVSNDGVHFKEVAFLVFGSDDTIFPNSTIIETPSISRMRDRTTKKIKDIMFIGVQDFTLGSNYKTINGEGHIAVQGHVNNQGIFIPDGSRKDEKILKVI